MFGHKTSARSSLNERPGGPGEEGVGRSACLGARGEKERREGRLGRREGGERGDREGKGGVEWESVGEIEGEEHRLAESIPCY